MSADQPMSDEARADLVAYLAGEADPEASRQVAAGLARDPALRDEARSLNQTWDLLDLLDMPRAADRFTQAALEVTGAWERDRPGNARRLWLPLAIFAFALGMLLARVIRLPERRIASDLSTVERLDELEGIHSVGFLRELRDQKLFPRGSDAKP